MVPARTSKRPVRKANGDAIRALREAIGVRPADFAGRVGISRPYLVNVEAGRKGATPAVLRRIADELGVPLAAVTSVQQPCPTCSREAA